MSDLPPETTAPTKRRRRLPGAPKRRNCEIYERHVLAGETQEQVAAAFGISRQRVGQIAARVEGWLATHGDHPLAQQMRLRTNRRWDAIWSRAIEGFDRSREDREVKKERTARPTTSGEAEPPFATFGEITIRQQNGDPRFLAIAVRVAEREDRRWQQAEPRSPALTELEERVAVLEAEEQKPTRENETGTLCQHGPRGSLALHKTHRSPPPPLQPPTPDHPDYLHEVTFDLESCRLKDEGDREGWKARQRQLKRDLAFMIWRDWPDIDDVPPRETIACEAAETAARKSEHDETREEPVARVPDSTPQPSPPGDLAEMIRRDWPDIEDEPPEETAPLENDSAKRNATRSGTATRPHPNPLLQGEGTARDDDDHRAATAARKRGASAPRPFFVAFSSRATQYDR